MLTLSVHLVCLGALTVRFLGSCHGSGNPGWRGSAGCFRRASDRVKATTSINRSGSAALVNDVVYLLDLCRRRRRPATLSKRERHDVSRLAPPRSNSSAIVFFFKSTTEKGRLDPASGNRTLFNRALRCRTAVWWLH